MIPNDHISIEILSVRSAIAIIAVPLCLKHFITNLPRCLLVSKHARIITETMDFRGFPMDSWIFQGFPMDFPYLLVALLPAQPVLRNHVSLGSLLGRATQGIAQLEESLELQRCEPWNHGLVKGNHPQDSRTFLIELDDGKIYRKP